MVLVAKDRGKGKTVKAPAPPPPMPRVELVPVPPPLPPPESLPPVPPPVFPDADLVAAGVFFVQGEGIGSVDAASGQEMRRWPSLDEVSKRFNVSIDTLRQRSQVDGWEGRRSIFQADLNKSRQRGIAERIAEQEMPSRLAYIGVHNDSMRALGRLLQKMAPQDAKDLACTPRDIKVVLETACKAAELLSHATGKARDSQGAFSLAVQVAQAQSLGVPVTSVAPALQGTLASMRVGSPGEDVKATAKGAGSIFAEILDARAAVAAQADSEALAGEGSFSVSAFEEPSPLPENLRESYGDQ